MHSIYNVKFANVQQAKEVHKYKNTGEKLYKCNAAIWYKEICMQKHLVHNYIQAVRHVCMVCTKL